MVTKEEVDAFLNEAKKMINKKQFIIIPRDKNKEFINKYRINSAKQKEILMSINTSDFIGAKKSRKKENHILYEFVKDIELDFYGLKENVKIYLKLDNHDKMIRVEIVSFHEAEFTPKFCM